MKSSLNFQKIDNPFLVGNPVKNKEMFFGRNENFRILKNWIVNDGPHVILLLAGRRAGKTSILLQIYNGRLKEHCESIFCDFHNIGSKITSDEDLPKFIIEELVKNPQLSSIEHIYKTEVEKITACHVNSIELANSYSKLLIRLLKECLNILHPKKLVILCDEFDALEKLFEKGILSSTSIDWAESIFSESIFFIMTSSHKFKNSHVRNTFGHVSQEHVINELSKEDTIKLICQPVENEINYEADAINLIYRLSGGQPFYTQYICQILISDINQIWKRNTVLSTDLEQVISFINDNPIGHIQETWRELSDPEYQPPKITLHVLSALATSITNSNEYIPVKKILKMSKKRRFDFSIHEVNRTLAWIKTNTRLVEWEGDAFRFKIDILRYWIAASYPTSEDVEEYIDTNVKPRIERRYREKITEVLKLGKGDISTTQRGELQKIAYELNIDTSNAINIENEIRRSLRLPDYIPNPNLHSNRTPFSSIYLIMGVLIIFFISMPMIYHLVSSGISSQETSSQETSSQETSSQETSSQEVQSPKFDEETESEFYWVSKCNIGDRNCNDGFWIAQNRISTEIWEKLSREKSPYSKKQEYITNVQWKGANAFAKSLDKRLCTKSEWLAAYNASNILADFNNNVGEFIVDPTNSVEVAAYVGLKIRSERMAVKQIFKGMQSTEISFRLCQD